MESVQEADSESDSEEDPSVSMDETVEEKHRLCDGKKWTAVAFISFGIILTVLEIANVAVLNPWYRIFCPGIWMGIIFVFTGGVSIAYYKLDHLQRKRISMAKAPPNSPPSSHAKIFRIIYLILNALSVALAVAMLVVLGLLIHSLQEEPTNPSDTMFAMSVAQITLYSLVIIAAFIGFLFLIRHKPAEASAGLKSETALVKNSSVAENPV